jgi:hypothetical protein
VGTNYFYLGIIMALEKSIETNIGVNATYWNIFSINENFRAKTVEVLVFGYASKQTRDANLDPISVNTYEFNGDNYLKDATRSAVYNKLKTTDFSDAQDV